MTSEEIFFALLALLVFLSFVIATLVSVAIAITDIVEGHRARRKSMHVAAGFAERSRHVPTKQGGKQS